MVIYVCTLKDDFLYFLFDSGIRYTMMICSLIAAVGVVVTYFFIPTYGVDMLVQEGTYMVLDHACLQPSDADMMLLDGYELVEGEETAQEQQQLLPETKRGPGLAGLGYQQQLDSERRWQGLDQPYTP